MIHQLHHTHAQTLAQSVNQFMTLVLSACVMLTKIIETKRNLKEKEILLNHGLITRGTTR